MQSNPVKPPPIKAILFDAYGTLLDVHSVASLAETLFPMQGLALSLLLREKQIEYSRLRSMANQYKPFWEITRDALRFACAAKGLSLGAEKEQRLMDQYAHLTAFPENLKALQALKARGLPMGVLTNGNQTMISSSLNNAAMSPYFDHVLTSETVKKFKPDPAIYALGPQALNIPAAQILFVSSNAWDACAAQWFGYQAFWINRAQATLEVLDIEPSYRGTQLTDILDIL